MELLRYIPDYLEIDEGDFFNHIIEYYLEIDEKFTYGDVKDQIDNDFYDILETYLERSENIIYNSELDDLSETLNNTQIKIFKLQIIDYIIKRLDKYPEDLSIDDE